MSNQVFDEVKAIHLQTFPYISRDVFRTQSNIYDGAFLQKYLTIKRVNYFRKNTSS